MSYINDNVQSNTSQGVSATKFTTSSSTLVQLYPKNAAHNGFTQDGGGTSLR